MREGHYHAQSQAARNISRLEKRAPDEQPALDYLASTPRLSDDDCGAVFFAAAFGYPKVLNLLIDRKLDVYAATTQSVGWTPLTAAAAEGQLETVQVLIERKASKIDETTSIRFIYYFFPGLDGRETALHWAARQGRTQIVQYLLLHGASVNAKTMGGQTALDLAKKYGNPETVRILEEHGAK